MIDSASPVHAIKPDRSFPRQKMDEIRLDEKKRFRDQLKNDIETTKRRIEYITSLIQHS